MCFVLPVVYIALRAFALHMLYHVSAQSYADLIVQPRRFDLFHGFGCRPATYPTVATIFLVTIPPLLFTGATIVCAGMSSLVSQV